MYKKGSSKHLMQGNEKHVVFKNTLRNSPPADTLFIPMTRPRKNSAVEKFDRRISKIAITKLENSE
jgi:hypothetical protein